MRFIAPDRVRRIRDLEPWREDEEIDTEAIVQKAVVWMRASYTARWR